MMYCICTDSYHISIYTQGCILYTTHTVHETKLERELDNISMLSKGEGRLGSKLMYCAYIYKINVPTDMLSSYQTMKH